jgi:hypothetical protein
MTEREVICTTDDLEAAWERARDLAGALRALDIEGVLIGVRRAAGGYYVEAHKEGENHDRHAGNTGPAHAIS